MAVEKFTDGMIILGTRNLSAKHSQLSVAHSAQMLDGTTFGDNTVENVAGLLEWSITGEGYWDAGTDVASSGTVFVDSIHGQIGGPAIGLTVAPKNADLGVAYTMNVAPEALNYFGQIGELIPFTLDAKPATSGVRGFLGMHSVQRAASGNGSIIQIVGGVPANKRLVGMVHLTQLDGAGTFTPKVQSAATGGFGAPDDEIPFTPLTALGWERIQVGSIITNEFFRASWTFTGGTSFTAVLVFGVVTT